MAEVVETKEEKPNRKGTGGGRPKKAEGELFNKRITILVQDSFREKMKADMKMKGKRSMTDYVIAAIEEYMNK